MPIWGSLGPLGSGKSLFLTIKLLQYLEQGYDVYSNYTVEGVKKIDARTFIDLKKRSDRVRVIGIDEVYTWFEGRLAMSKTNIFMRYLIIQSRKRGNDIMYSAPHMTTMDYSLQRLTDVFTYCKKRKDAFEYAITNREKLIVREVPLHIAKQFYDKYDTYEIVPVPKIDIKNLMGEIQEKVEVKEVKIK